MKVLIVSTVSGFVPQFEMNNVRILQRKGCEVHYASNFNNPVYGNDNHRLDNTNIKRYQVDFVRSPWDLVSNFRAYKQLLMVIKQEDFEIIHCHTPMGGVLTRLALRKAKHKKVIYTAHGFHFFKGAPIKNWIIFYLIERILARYTDILITINNEDYSYAKKFKLKSNGIVQLIPGVGIDINQGNQIDKISERGRKKSNKEFVLISVGELTKRKNHQVMIRAVRILLDNGLNVKYIICGDGYLKKYLSSLISSLQLDKNVKLLGYKEDVGSILREGDCFILPSKQEGLPVAVLEAMKYGLPVICYNTRGCNDLIDNEKGGILVNKQSKVEYSKAVELVIKMNQDNIMGEYNLNKVNKYTIDKVGEFMESIYDTAIKDLY